MRKFMIMLATTFAAGLLFVNIYNSLVDAVSWGSNMPASIQTARDYYKTVSPGNFYRTFSPLNQVIALIALIVCWKAGKQIRIYLALALVLALLSDGLTFGYFYPRNDIMFTSSIDSNLEAIKTAWREWSTMNWVRSALVLLNVSFNFIALAHLFKNDNKQNK